MDKKKTTEQIMSHITNWGDCRFQTLINTKQYDAATALQEEFREWFKYLDTPNAKLDIVSLNKGI